MLTSLVALAGMFGPVLRASDFGAIPNDGEDDLPALSKGLTEAATKPGSVLSLAPGVYTISSALFLPSGVTLAGAGIAATKIKVVPGPGRDPIGIQNASPEHGNRNISLRDFTLDASRDERPGSQAMGIRIIGLKPSQCDSISLLRVGVQNVPFAAIQLMGCRNVKVQNCLIQNANRDGITVWDNSAHVLIEGNRVYGVGDDCIGLNSQRHSVRDAQIRDVTVRNNTLRQAEDSIYGTGIRLAGIDGAIVERNEIQFAQGWGILVEGGDTNAGGDGNPGLEVTLKRQSDGSAILRLAGVLDGGPFVLRRGSRRTAPIPTASSAAEIRSGLKMLGVSAQVTGPEGGPFALTGSNLDEVTAMPFAVSENVKVVGNRVERSGCLRSGAGGIDVRIGSIGSIVKDNTVRGYFAGGIIAGTGCQLLSNTVLPGLPSHPTSAMIIRGDQVVAKGNRLSGVVTDGIELRGSGALISGNRIELAETAGYGIRAYAGSSSIISSNKFATKGHGRAIRLPEAAGHRLRQNTFSGFSSDQQVMRRD